ncbi:MAG TPA: hypothetical protein DCZ76_09535 [Treponema sp.]|nr:hypothetical protein [Treponema sp.]
MPSGSLPQNCFPVATNCPRYVAVNKSTHNFSPISTVPKYRGKNRKAKNRANGKSNKRSKDQQLVLMPFFIIRIRKPAKLNNVPNQKKQRHRRHYYE